MLHMYFLISFSIETSGAYSYFWNQKKKHGRRAYSMLLREEVGVDVEIAGEGGRICSRKYLLGVNV